MDSNEIVKIYGENPVGMTVALLEYADLAADIGDSAKKIGIKPNLVCPTPASFGATTHSEIVEGIIIYLQKNGYKNITILEGSWVGDKTADAYEYCGYRALCEKYGVSFFDTQKDTYHTVDCAGMELAICDVVDEIDYLINVPVLKGHCQTRVTCALKNMKGLIPNSEKRRFHTMGLHKPIAHLSMGIHQDFIVVDNICGDPDFEEGGNPLKTDCVMVAKDPVLVDAYACSVLGRGVSEVLYIGYAENLGSGSTDLSEAIIRVIGENKEVVKCHRGDEDDASEHSFSTQHFDVNVDIDEVDACSACYASLTGVVYQLREEGLWNSDTIGPISIGQGHRGRTGRFGIGNCCRLFDEYIPGCPPREEEIYEVLKIKGNPDVI